MRPPSSLCFICAAPATFLPVPWSLAARLATALGMVAVGFYLFWIRSRLPTPSEPPQGDRAGAARRLVRLVLIPLIGGTVAGLVRLRHPHPLLTKAIWDAAW